MYDKSGSIPSLLQVTHLVVSNPGRCEDSHKVQMATKYGIPVVSLDFIDHCVAQGRLVDTDSFVVAGRTAADEFKTGKIVGECQHRAHRVSTYIISQFIMYETVIFSFFMSFGLHCIFNLHHIVYNILFFTYFTCFSS